MSCTGFSESPEHMPLAKVAETDCSGLEDVIHDNLRPPDPEPGMHTKGRKSALKK